MAEPADLAVGKRWRSAYTNTRSGQVGNAFYDFRVVGLEDVTVPAGTFKTYKVEGVGMSGEGYLSQVRWIDPATMISVRYDLVFRPMKSNRVFEHSSTQLVSFGRAPR